jgi:hypothetical protein
MRQERRPEGREGGLPAPWLERRLLARDGLFCTQASHPRQQSLGSREIRWYSHTSEKTYEYLRLLAGRQPSGAPINY